MTTISREEAEKISQGNIQRFTRDVIQPKLTPDQVARYYDEYSPTYDTTMFVGELGYSSFNELCKTVTELLPPDADKSELRALDVGCGTGIIGWQLRQLGFDNVDGVDGSAGMIEQSVKRGIYRQTYVEIIENRSLTEVPRDAYDVIVSKGAFLPNHVHPSSLPFIGELLKKGGLLGVEIRQSLIAETEMSDFEPVARNMAATGDWKILRWRQESIYNITVTGFIYVLQKL